MSALEGLYVTFLIQRKVHLEFTDEAFCCQALRFSPRRRVKLGTFPNFFICFPLQTVAQGLRVVECLVECPVFLDFFLLRGGEGREGGMHNKNAGESASLTRARITPVHKRRHNAGLLQYCVGARGKPRDRPCLSLNAWPIVEGEKKRGKHLNVTDET